MIVINQGRVNYRYKVSEDSPVIYNTILSNSVVTSVLDKNLNVSKEVDKVIATIYDILTYKINIINISDNTVNNVFLKDKIPNGTKFVNDSVEINGLTQFGVTPENLYIGNINSCKKITVTFQVVICEMYDECKNEITNEGYIYYDYKYNIEEKPIQICLVTNKVNTYVMYNIFTQTSVSASLKICLRPCEKIKICYIDSCGKVLKCKLIKTVVGKKILVLWEINYCLYYLRYFNNYQYEVCNDTCKEYFSTLLDVPCGAETCSTEFFKIVNENCSYNYLCDKNELIIYNTVLIIANNF